MVPFRCFRSGARLDARAADTRAAPRIASRIAAARHAPLLFRLGVATPHIAHFTQWRAGALLAHFPPQFYRSAESQRPGSQQGSRERWECFRKWRESWRESTQAAADSPAAQHPDARKIGVPALELPLPAKNVASSCTPKRDGARRLGRSFAFQFVLVVDSATYYCCSDAEEGSRFPVPCTARCDDRDSPWVYSSGCWLHSTSTGRGRECSARRCFSFVSCLSVRVVNTESTRVVNMNSDKS